LNRLVFITGTSSGIGKATVERFSKEGWKVVATMRRAERAKEFGWPDNVVVKELDVTDHDGVSRVAREVIEEHGIPYAVINNAGCSVMGSVEDTPLEDAKRVFEVNYFGTVSVIRAFLPHMIKKGEGVIVNLSSVVGRNSMPLIAHYCATKFAIEGLSEALWHEVKKFGVRVVVIEPGAIKTQLVNKAKVIPSTISEGSPYGKMAKRVAEIVSDGSPPEEVADTIWKAVNSKSDRLRYAVGKNAGYLLLRRLLPESIYLTLAYGYYSG